MVYNITKTDLFDPIETVLLTDQFGTIEADVFEAHELWVPTNKTHGIDFFPNATNIHWKCYFIEPVTPFLGISGVDLSDQFTFNTHEIFFPGYLCNPVEKSLDGGTTFEGDATIPDHMICYDIDPFPAFAFAAPPFSFEDQFQSFSPPPVFDASRLCTVASKVVLSGLGPVGGTSLPIDTTALLVGGFNTNSIWMIPAVLGIVGAGIVVFKLKRK